MKDKKKEQIAEALSGISYGDWCAIKQTIDKSYHVIKKELTSNEINSRINAFKLPSDN